MLLKVTDYVRESILVSDFSKGNWKSKEFFLIKVIFTTLNISEPRLLHFFVSNFLIVANMFHFPTNVLLVPNYKH